MPNRTDVVKEEIYLRIFDWSEKQKPEEAKAVIPRPHKPPLNDDAYEKKRALLITSKLELGNFKDVVELICSNNKPAKHNAETLQTLQRIRPTSAADQKHLKPSYMNLLQVTRATVSQVIKSFLPGSTGGSDELTPQQIKDMTRDETNLLMVEVITDFVNLGLLLSGISDQLINNIFYTDRLTVL